jgi:hypothetical protein
MSCLCCTAQANVYFDNFQRANGTLGSNWTVTNGSWLIVSNTAQANTPTTYNLAYWATNTVSNDQSAMVTLTALVAGTYIGPAVRLQSGSGSGYVCISDLSGNTFIQKIVSGAATTLSTGATSAVGHTLELRIIGTTLSCYDNGSLVLSTTDPTYSSGSIGIAEYNNGGSSLTPWTGQDRSATGSGGQFISAPMLPALTPNVAYPPDTGYTLTPVTSAANLQTAIANAACGTKLNLAHNGTFTTATPWTLPALDVGSNACACHTDPTKYRIIQGDQFEANYTPGVRVDPSAQYAQFPHLSSSDANSTFTANANGSSCWGFAGLDVTETTNNAQDVFGINDLDNQTQANLSHDFAWWGDYVHGQPTLNIKRGLALNGATESIVDSYLAEFHYVGIDSNAIVGWDGTGPIYVNNNFLEGATENFLLGGAQPLLPVQTCDVTFTGNHSWKPLSWRPLSPTYAGINWNHKNAFELKEGCRILVSRNVLEYAWSANQDGTLFLINSGSAGGIDPQGYLQDVTVTSNVIRNGAFALAFGAIGDTLYQNNHRLSFSNNLWYNLDGYAWGSNLSCCKESILIGGKAAGTIFAMSDISQNHETFAETTAAQTSNSESAGITYANVPNVDYHYGLQSSNSIIPRGFNGAFTGVSVSPGDPVVAAYAPGLIANNDCIYGANNQGETYNNAAFTGKQLILSGLSGVFVAPGSDYHVAASSACHLAGSDGLDMGANVTNTLAVTANVVQTLANVHTVTNVSPSTFTHTGGTSVTITGSNFVVNGGTGESGLGVIFGGAGPTSTISTVTCTVNTCTVVMSTPISLQVNDTVSIPDAAGAFNNQGQFAVASVTDTTHFTYTDTGVGTQSWSGGTANRVTPGNACTSVSVVSSTSITCTTPAASGTVTTGPVSVFVSQFGIPVQSAVFGNYN